MKRTFKTILCAAAVVMASVSCQKSTEPVQTAEEGKETIDICVNGLMGEYAQVDGTKAELVNTVRVSWEGDETVYVFDGVKCLGSLAASLEGDEDRYAVLSTDGAHTVSTPADGTTTLTLVYSPLLTEAPTVNDGAISISLASQSGEKAPFVAYATLDYTSTTIKNVVVPFHFATSVIKVNCTGLKPGTAITSASLSNVNTECKLTLSGDGAPTVSGITNGTITRTGDEYFANTKINDEGEAVFQIAVPKLETASGVRVLTVAQSSDKAKDKKFTTKSLNPATSVNTVCQLVGLPVGALEGEFSVGPNTTDKVYFSKGNLYAKKDDGGAWKWHFYDEQYKFLAADMNVSGSMEYPQRNVAADEKEIHLFTWGYNAAKSIDPDGSDYVDGHTSNEDKQLKPSTGGDDWGVAYCESNNITVGTWRTLTTAEWQYLFNTRSNASNLYKCGVTVCGSVNCLVIAPDDWDLTAHPLQSSYGTDSSEGNPMTWEQAEAKGLVCLPAAGRRHGSYVYDVGGSGSYWSSTANDSDLAYLVYFASDYVDPDGLDRRFNGFSVRIITECQ